MLPTRTLLPLAIIAGTLAFAACDDDDPILEENEEELITTVTLTLTPDGGAFVTFSLIDLDGPGGVAPVTTSAPLAANTEYGFAIQLLNATETPPENVTLEVAEEAEEHQFFFEVDGVDVDVAYGDTDSEGRPIGIVGTMTTNDAGTGTLTVTLRHEPAKDAAGVVDGDITNAGGETDVEAEFDLVVE